MAKEFLKCPSGNKSGDLGRFAKDVMVIFKDELHVVHGSFKIEFGFHFIEITSRG